MYNVSQEYKDSIFAQTRTVKGRVTFAIVDTTATEDVDTITVTSEYEWSDK